jgi:molybdopterin molybdotransferase
MFVKAIARHDLRSDGRRETYLWGQLRLDTTGTYEFHLAGGSHSSGNLINLAQTTGLAVVPVGQKLISAGEPVQVLQVGSPVRINIWTTPSLYQFPQCLLATDIFLLPP